MRLINETSVSREAEEMMLGLIIGKYGREPVIRLK